MSNEALANGFLISYAVTGVALAVVLFLGRMRIIRGHIAAVVAFAAGFGVVIYFAESLGRRYEFGRTIEVVHLVFANVTAAVLVAVLVTGVRRWRGKGSLRAHRIAIVTFLALFVVASVTGFAMFRSGKPRVTSPAGR